MIKADYIPTTSMEGTVLPSPHRKAWGCSSRAHQGSNYPRHGGQCCAWSFFHQGQGIQQSSLERDKILKQRAGALALSLAIPLSGFQAVSLVLHLKLPGKAAFDLGEDVEASQAKGWLLVPSSISAPVCPLSPLQTESFIR